MRVTLVLLIISCFMHLTCVINAARKKYNLEYSLLALNCLVTRNNCIARQRNQNSLSLYKFHAYLSQHIPKVDVVGGATAENII